MPFWKASHRPPAVRCVIPHGANWALSMPARGPFPGRGMPGILIRTCNPGLTPCTGPAHITFRNPAPWLRCQPFILLRGTGCWICAQPRAERLVSLQMNWPERGSWWPMTRCFPAPLNCPAILNAWASETLWSPPTNRSSLQKNSPVILTKYWWMRLAPAKACSERTRWPAPSGRRRCPRFALNARGEYWTAQP